MVRSVALGFVALSLVAAAPAAPEETGFDPDSRLYRSVTVLDRGQKPRALIRYRPEPGVGATVETVLRMGARISAALPDGQVISTSQNTLPGLATTLRHSVGEKGPRGLVHVDVAATGARTVGPVPEGTIATYGETDDLWARLMVDRDGYPVSFVQIDPDPDRREAVQEFTTWVADRIVIFPREPIGPGARWVTPGLVTIGDRSVAVEQTFVVRDVTPEGVDCDVTMTLPAEGRIPGTTFAARGTIHTDLETLGSAFDLVMELSTESRMTLPEVGEVVVQTTMHLDSEARTVRVLAEAPAVNPPSRRSRPRSPRPPGLPRPRR